MWNAFGDTHLVNVAEDSLLDAIVLDNLAEHASVTTTNDQDLLRVGMRIHGEMCDHLLVAIPHQHLPYIHCAVKRTRTRPSRCIG